MVAARKKAFNATGAHKKPSGKRITGQQLGGLMLIEKLQARPLDVDSCLHLITTCAADLDQHDQNGMTPMIAAVLRGNDKILGAILDKKIPSTVAIKNGASEEDYVDRFCRGDFKDLHDFHREMDKEALKKSSAGTQSFNKTAARKTMARKKKPSPTKTTAGGTGPASEAVHVPVIPEMKKISFAEAIGKLKPPAQG